MEDSLDPIAALDRLVEEELERRHAFQAKPAADVTAEERRRALQGLARLAARLVVAERRVVDARDLQIRGDLDVSDGQEADAGIVNFDG